MLRNIIFYFLIFIQFFSIAQAKIDIVYPTQKSVTINAPSTFIFGNTDVNSQFYINSDPVKLWNNNFFVHVVPLNYGRNEIKFTSKKSNKEESLVYVITRNKPSKGLWKPQNFIPKPADSVLYSKTIKENATVREKPTSASNRVVDLPENVILYLDGRQGDYYKISETGNSNFWIHKSNISEPVLIAKEMKPKLKNIKQYSDKDYDYTKFYLSHPVLYTIKQNGKSIKLTLYGIETENTDKTISHNYEFTFNYDTPILGFDGYYKDNNFIFRRAKVNEINSKCPLKGIKFFVDAGHGGIEKGAVGPTRVNEKDINLKISKYLTEELQNSGAQVYTSRTDDIKVSLSERVKSAKSNNTLISVSIHCNSLPAGKDPYISHGTEVHYYNENAKTLAEIIQKNLVKDLNLKDNGIHKSSFALNRSTNPISILIEVAYMINPDEYILLQNPQFQKDTATSIKNSLEQYLINIKK